MLLPLLWQIKWRSVSNHAAVSSRFSPSSNLAGYGARVQRPPQSFPAFTFYQYSQVRGRRVSGVIIRLAFRRSFAYRLWGAALLVSTHPSHVMLLPVPPAKLLYTSVARLSAGSLIPVSPKFHADLFPNMRRIRYPIGKAKSAWWKKQELFIHFSQSDWYMASAPLFELLFTMAHQPIRKRETAELC